MAVTGVGEGLTTPHATEPASSSANGLIHNNNNNNNNNVISENNNGNGQSDRDSRQNHTAPASGNPGSGKSGKVAGNYSDESGFCDGDDDDDEIEVIYDRNAEENNNRKKTTAAVVHSTAVPAVAAKSSGVVVAVKSAPPASHLDTERPKGDAARVRSETSKSKGKKEIVFILDLPDSEIVKSGGHIVISCTLVEISFFPDK